MLSKVVAILSTVFALSNALNSVQVVNTNANMQSQSQNQYPYGGGGGGGGGYWQRPNNQLYVSGVVRSYQGGYPFYEQNYYPSNYGYRYRRQVPVTPIVKEANANYQYQGSNQYDERINPMYNSNYAGDFNTAYPYSDAYRYRENNQYQLQGNAQSRVEGDLRFGDQFNNRYQSQQQGSLHRQRYQY